MRCANCCLLYTSKMCIRDSVYADYITTVSDTYANEIQTEYYGEGLNGLLSARHFDMQGIVCLLYTSRCV